MLLSENNLEIGLYSGLNTRLNDDTKKGTYTSVVYFDQLTGAALNQKLVKLLFSTPFSVFFQKILTFLSEIGLKLTKNIKK